MSESRTRGGCAVRRRRISPRKSNGSADARVAFVHRRNDVPLGGLSYTLGTCESRATFDTELDNIVGSHKSGQFLPSEWETE
jgi:hypothetical protein